jgi:hypothetical protein
LKLSAAMEKPGITIFVASTRYRGS